MKSSAIKAKISNHQILSNLPLEIQSESIGFSENHVTETYYVEDDASHCSIDQNNISKFDICEIALKEDQSCFDGHDDLPKINGLNNSSCSLENSAKNTPKNAREFPSGWSSAVKASKLQEKMEQQQNQIDKLKQLLKNVVSCV